MKSNLRASLFVSALLTAHASFATTPPIADRCASSGRDRLWGQKILGSDLMQAWIEDHHLIRKETITPTFALDTGLDKPQLVNFYDGQNVHVEPGVLGAMNTKEDGTVTIKNLDHDPADHGTGVSSMIRGGMGIGTAPHSYFTFYKITNEDYSASPDVLLASIKRACLEGKRLNPNSAPIINLSFEDRDDESGENRDEKNDGLLPLLTQNGCIIYKGAGNQSFRNDDAAVNGSRLDQPYVRVASSNAYGGLSFFSSNGEVRAPGEKVFLLDSPSYTGNIFVDESCGPAEDQKRAKFAKGTSFSSPLAAGIASETENVLLSSPESRFAKLSPSDRIALMNRVVKASEFLGDINGLRAAIIAKNWAESAPSATLPTVADLQKQFAENPPAICADTPRDCRNDPDQDSCFFAERTRIVACPNPSANELENQATLAIQKGAFEIASQYLELLNQMNSDESTRFELLRQFVIATISNWIEPTSSLSPADMVTRLTNPQVNLITLSRFDVSLSYTRFGEYLSLLAKRSGDVDETEKRFAEKAFSMVFDLEQLRDDLYKGPGRGSEGPLQATVKNLQSLRAISGNEQFMTVVKTGLNHQMMPFHDTSDSRVTLPVRLLNAIAVLPAFDSLRPELTAYENEIFHFLDAHPVYFAPDAIMDEQVLFEIQATRSYVYAFLDREQAAVFDQLKTAAVSDIAPIKIAYGLDHQKEFKAAGGNVSDLVQKSKAVEGEGLERYTKEFHSKRPKERSSVAPRSALPVRFLPRSKRRWNFLRDCCA